MAQYILNKDFQLISETSGVIVNISNVKVELSEKPETGTGAILEPQSKVYFNNILYAACAPSDVGVAIIGVISGSLGGGAVIISPDEEYITYEDILALFGDSPPDWSHGGEGSGSGDDDSFRDYLEDLFRDEG